MVGYTVRSVSVTAGAIYSLLEFVECTVAAAVRNGAEGAYIPRVVLEHPLSRTGTGSSYRSIVGVMEKCDTRKKLVCL